MQAAFNGDQPTMLEWLLEGYYLTIETIEGVMKNNPSAKLAMDAFSYDLGSLKKYQRQLEAALCSAFIDAIRHRDGQKVLEIADAVWTVKNRNAKGFKDKDRYMLLSAKRMIGESGAKWTRKQIADCVDGKKSHTQYRMDKLWDMAGEISFPRKFQRKQKIKSK